MQCNFPAQNQKWFVYSSCFSIPFLTVPTRVPKPAISPMGPIVLASPWALGGAPELQKFIPGPPGPMGCALELPKFNHRAPGTHGKDFYKRCRGVEGLEVLRSLTLTQTAFAGDAPRSKMFMGSTENYENKTCLYFNFNSKRIHSKPPQAQK